MKKRGRYLLLPLLVLFLTGCRDAVRELYEKEPFNSPVFAENFYVKEPDSSGSSSWDDAFNKDSDGYRVDKDQIVRHENYPFKAVIPNLKTSKTDPTGLQDAGLDPVDRQYEGQREDKRLYWHKPDFNAPGGYGVEFGRTKNLFSIENTFGYGILSKLYDGRICCEGKYQRSRVQLDKTGYSTFFPKQLESAHLFAFALRGGTTLPDGTFPVDDLLVNIDISFYVPVRDSYKQHLYELKNVPITNDHGVVDTTLVSFYFNKDHRSDNAPINGATAMSMQFELVSLDDQLAWDGRAAYKNFYKTADGKSSLTSLADCSEEKREEVFAQLTDDKTVPAKDSSKKYFSIMLYEVMLPSSRWS